MGYYEDRCNQILKCEIEEQAQRLFNGWVAERFAEGGHSEEELRTRMLGNFGYCAGYYSKEDGAKILRFLHTTHPFFGNAEDFIAITPEAAFELGRREGAKMKRKNE